MVEGYGIDGINDWHYDHKVDRTFVGKRDCYRNFADWSNIDGIDCFGFNLYPFFPGLARAIRLEG